MIIETMCLRRYRYACLIINVVFLSACAGAAGPIRLYEGPKKPDNEIARFLVPSELEVVAIDGKALEAPYVPDGQYQVELLPGDHQIAVVYSEYWGDDTVGSLVVSDAFYFQFATAAGGTYVFKHNGPEDLVNANFDTLIGDIKIWLEQRKTGQTINAASTSAYGGFLARTIRQVATGQGEGTPKAGVPSLQTNNAQAASPTLPLPTDTGAASALIAEQIIAQQNALDRLKFWWKMADQKQRKAFQAWTDGE